MWQPPRLPVWFSGRQHAALHWECALHAPQHASLVGDRACAMSLPFRPAPGIQRQAVDSEQPVGGARVWQMEGSYAVIAS